MEDSDSLQFAIRNLNSTLMTLQKDVEELKNSKPASEPAPAKMAVAKESFPQFHLPQPDAGLIIIPQQLMLMHQNPSSASLLQKPAGQESEVLQTLKLMTAWQFMNKLF